MSPAKIYCHRLVAAAIDAANRVTASVPPDRLQHWVQGHIDRQEEAQMVAACQAGQVRVTRQACRAWFLVWAWAGRRKETPSTTP